MLILRVRYSNMLNNIENNVICQPNSTIQKPNEMPPIGQSQINTMPETRSESSPNESSKSNEMLKLNDNPVGYDIETQALTKRGFLSFAELNTEDEVLTYNLKNGCVEWNQIEDVCALDYNGEMINLSGKRFSFNITPNTNMLIHRINHNKKESPEYELAEEATNRCYFGLIGGSKWKGGIGKVFKFEDGIEKDNFPSEMETNDLFYLIGLFIGDGFAYRSDTINKNKTGFDKKDYMKKCRGNNGRFTKNSGEKGKKGFGITEGLRVNFCLPESDKARYTLFELYEKYNIKYWFNQHQIGITSKRFYTFCKQFGDGAKNKSIPRWILEYDSSHLKFLFEGLIHSDGNHSAYRKGSSPKYYTSSKILLDSMVELGTKLGYFTVYSKLTRSCLLDGRKVEGTGWWVCFSKVSKSIRPLNKKRIIYDGKIWNIKLKNKNFLSIRNKRANFCGSI